MSLLKTLPPVQRVLLAPIPNSCGVPALPCLAVVAAQTLPTLPSVAVEVPAVLLAAVAG
jgi:hypothetical protein